MRATIVRQYELSCAHRLLDGVPVGHRCRRPHGHSYRVELAVAAELNEHGMVIEYGDLDRIVKPVLAHLDHHDLNTLPERYSGPLADALAANPTVERLCAFLFGALRDLVGTYLDAKRQTCLLSVRIREDERSSAEVGWVP